jgi:hypothetical protein
MTTSTSLLGSFTCRKSAICDRRLYFPSEGRHGENFFALKNPTASAGFEPANLGTRGQHATPRPPKSLTTSLGQNVFFSTLSPHIFSLCSFLILKTSIFTPNTKQNVKLQYDQKVSVHLIVTIQKVTSSVQSVTRQSAARQGQGDTRLTLTPSAIPNSNYIIMVNDWNCLKYFCVFLYCNHQVHRYFLITLYTSVKFDVWAFKESWGKPEGSALNSSKLMDLSTLEKTWQLCIPVPYHSVSWKHHGPCFVYPLS